MDVRQLRSCLVLAGELHFSRAAVRLGVSQSTLSVRLRGLEHELGVRLFEPTSRSVALTDAGRHLLAEAATALAVLSDTVDTARHGTPRDAHLRIGASTAARYGVTGAVLDRYDLMAADGPSIEVREEASGAVLRAFARHALDVCITFCSPSPPSASSERLVHTRAMLTFSAREPAARSGCVSIAELAHLPLTLIADRDSDGFNATALAACRAAGIEPEIAWIPRGEADEAFRRAGGFTFVSRWARGFEPDDIVIADIDGEAPMLTYDLVWRDDRAPGVSEFLAAARHERAARGWIER
jgi:DNA-binding transcriptional LysR family regulator